MQCLDTPVLGALSIRVLLRPRISLAPPLATPGGEVLAMSSRPCGTLARIVLVCLCLGLYGTRGRLLQQAADATRRPSICHQIAILPRPSRAPPPAGRRLSRILSAPERMKGVLCRGRRGRPTVLSGSEMIGSAVGWPASGRPGFPLIVRPGPKRALT